MTTTYPTNSILSRRVPVWTKFFIPVLVLFFASCKKDSDVGIGIQPEEDIIGLYSTDAVPLVTSTVLEDSLRTDETPTVVIGTCEDQIFGTTKCGMFSQFSIPDNLQDINFQSNGFAILDSAVLMLSYNFDYYGDTLAPQTFNVYQMTEPLYKDSVYYSNHAKSYYPGAIGSLTFEPHPRRSVVIDTNSLAAHVRIPINYNWAQQIFAQGTGASGQLHSNTTWRDYMNGLYIESGSTGKNLLYFNPLDTLTGLRLYYHTSTAATSFSFVVNSTTPYYSYYQHDYSSSIFASSIGQTGLANVYVQSNAGVKTKIEFPTLNDWYNNLGYEAAINKAELVIFGVPDPNAPDNFPLNTRMFVTSIDSVGKEHLLIDMFESSGYYGGSLNTTTNVYKINIARYIQSILTGDQQNNGLYLKEIFGTENGRRSVLGGTDPNYKMYLHLVYTRIN